MFCKCLAPLCALSQKGTQLANLLQPISNLAIRIWLGYEFFKSGLLIFCWRSANECSVNNTTGP